MVTGIVVAVLLGLAIITAAVLIAVFVPRVCHKDRKSSAFVDHMSEVTFQRRYDYVNSVPSRQNSVLAPENVETEDVLTPTKSPFPGNPAFVQIPASLQKAEELPMTSEIELYSEVHKIPSTPTEDPDDGVVLESGSKTSDHDDNEEDLQYATVLKDNKITVVDVDLLADDTQEDTERDAISNTEPEIPAKYVFPEPEVDDEKQVDLDVALLKTEDNDDTAVHVAEVTADPEDVDDANTDKVIPPVLPTEQAEVDLDVVLSKTEGDNGGAAPHVEEVAADPEDIDDVYTDKAIPLVRLTVR